MGQKVDTFTIIGNVLISIYRFDVRHIWLDRKVNLEKAEADLTSPHGGKAPAAPTHFLQLERVYILLCRGRGQMPQENLIMSSINLGFYYCHIVCCSFCLSAHVNCVVWVSRGGVRRWEVAWKCYLVEQNENQTSCSSSLSCPEQGVQQLLEIGWSPSRSWGHSSRFQEVLRATGCCHCVYPSSQVDLDQTVMTIRKSPAPHSS